MVRKCNECGCACKMCLANDHDVHLHLEIENLKQQLIDNKKHILSMETNFLKETQEAPESELHTIREELTLWQEKYQRLYEAHGRIQRVNQSLEDKLLKLVDSNETEKNALVRDVAILSKRLAETNYALKKITTDNERYKTDVSIAIQFLQCKQGNFVAHKLDSLSQDVQTQVSSYMGGKHRTERRLHEGKSIKVPIPTFPPTAMVYSVPKIPIEPRKIDVEAPSKDDEIVSAAIMAKVLEERLKEKITKHCNTCTCTKEIDELVNQSTETIETQTEIISRRSDSTQTQNKPQKQKEKTRKMSSEMQQTMSNNCNSVTIAKVQPNNFLLDDKTYQDPHMHETIDNLLIQRAQDISGNASSSGGNKNLLLDNIDSVLLYAQPKETRPNSDLTRDETEQPMINRSIRPSSTANYEEMEENVRKFLFKEKSLLRAIDGDSVDSNRTLSNTNRISSSIETEI